MTKITYENGKHDSGKQKKLHESLVKKSETREKEKEFDGLTLREMRRKHSIPVHVGGQEILDAYNADKIGTVKEETTAEEIAHQRKILDQAKMELEWDRKERDSRKELEGEETEARRSNPEESQARRANPLTAPGSAIDKGVFSMESVVTSDMARQYMNPGQVLERTMTLEGHIELDKFSIEMMALEDVVILRDLCNNHLNSMVKKISIIK